jgi:hypothetical protein
MSIYFAEQVPEAELSAEEARTGLFETLSALGERNRVLATPPGFARFIRSP